MKALIRSPFGKIALLGGAVAFLSFGALPVLEGGFAGAPAAAQYGGGGNSEPDDGRSEKKTKRVGTLSTRVADNLLEAQEAFQEENYQEAKELIDDAAETRNPNNYDLAMINQMYAYLYSSLEDYDRAAVYFERVLEVADDTVPEGVVEGSLFNLGQLYMVQEKYQKAIETINRWLSTNPDAGSDAYVLLAQAHFQLDQFQQTIRYITVAIDKIKAQGQQVKENWYQILLASYFELNNYPKVRDTLEILISLYPKKNYYLQLSGVYSELGQEKKQFYMMELAHRQGFLESSGELLNMAQLYAFHQMPHEAAQLLCSRLESGEIESNDQNWEMCGNFWINAEEHRKAIEPLTKAAQMSGDGDIYVRIAQIYSAQREYAQAAEFYRRALNAGDLRDPEQVWMLRGTALMNEATRFDKRGFDKEAFDAAEAAFDRAAREKKYAKSAGQWKRFIRKEKQRIREEIDLGSRPAN